MKAVPGKRRGFLIVGADGLIGRSVFECLKRRSYAVFGTSRNIESSSEDIFFLDLEDDPHSFFARPDVKTKLSFYDLTVIFAAGITNVSLCEKHPQLSKRVNVMNTLQYIDNFLKREISVVYLSSNAVFNANIHKANVDCVYSPTTLYGKQKMEVEKALIRNFFSKKKNPSIMICRLTKVVDSANPLFSTWISELKAGKTIRAFNDRVVAPISLEYTTEALINIGLEGRTGIYHLTSAQHYTYFEFARKLASALDVSESLVLPTSSDLGSAFVNGGILSDDSENARIGIAPQDFSSLLQNLI